VYWPLDSSRFLIDHRLTLSNFADRRLDEKVAGLIERKPLGAIKSEFNVSETGSWSQNEVILEFTPAAVIQEIYAGINVVELDSRIVGDVRSPLLRIITDKVIRLTRQLIGRRYSI
jgi:hypothetical protein